MTAVPDIAGVIAVPAVPVAAGMAEVDIAVGAAVVPLVAVGGAGVSVGLPPQPVSNMLRPAKTDIDVKIRRDLIKSIPPFVVYMRHVSCFCVGAFLGGSCPVSRHVSLTPACNNHTTFSGTRQVRILAM